MDEQEIARLRELASKRTKGEWEYCITDDGEVIVFAGKVKQEIGEFGTSLGKYRDTVFDPANGWPVNEDDWNYIVAAVNTHEALLDENAQQRAEIARLREALQVAQWSRKVETSDATFRICPVCSGIEGIGHKISCAIGLALKVGGDE